MAVSRISHLPRQQRTFGCGLRISAFKLVSTTVWTCTYSTQRADIAMAQPEAKPATKPPSLVMQIILPKTLVTEHKWPTGPLMAQAAHAVTAVLHENAELQSVKDYLSDLPNMRKTVMEVADEAKLREIEEKLKTLDPAIPYHLWIEQPENTPTALALVPNNRPKALKKILDQAGCRLWQ